MNIEERTEFEAFASKHGLCVTEDGDLYRSHVLAWMWKAWQARAALTAQDEALLRQALEALEQIATDLPWELTGLQADTIAALRERLGEGEPR